MNERRRYTLAQRLFAMSAVLISCTVAVACSVWFLMADVAGNIEWLGKHRLPQMVRVAEIELNITRASLSLRHAMLARNPAEMDEALGVVAEKKRWLEAEVAALGAGMATPEGKAKHAAMVVPLQRFFEAVGTDIGLIQAGKKNEAFAFLVDRVVPVRNELLALTGAEKVRQSKKVAAGLTEIVDHASTARNVVASAMVVLSLGLVGFCVYVLSVMRQLGAEPGDLKRVAQGVADGDLAVDIALRPGDSHSVMAAMHAMCGKLAHTVRAVRRNADSVATASEQIAQGNADLSQRTERQSSALQQTASAMHQLDSTVRQNAENARLANQFALTSSQVAAAGGQTVQDVVQTMRGINQSSRRIAEIIGVIDGIAFQTNILALNAAVEAARAGEQGRGFAVVASEVRNLAQRSADAAREIKALIGDSVGRVEQGTAQVDRAGATMQEIVTAIGRVTEIVGQISAASAEQSAGVSEIGQNVSQMDQATQQNAALVEQSAAAAESLKQQSLQLVQAVATFKLA